MKKTYSTQLIRLSNIKDAMNFGFIPFAYIYVVYICNVELNRTFYHLSALTLLVFSLGFLSLKLFKANDKLRNYVFSILLSICYVFFFQALAGKINTAANLDVYQYALSSNTLSSNSNFSNIYPYGTEYWNTLKKDALGAYVFNGYLSFLFAKNALYFTTINILLISLGLFWGYFYVFIKSRISILAAFVSSFAVLGNPFYVYLMANYFFSQLLSFIFLLFGLGLYINLVDKKTPSLIRGLAIFPWIFLVFITYQSGFFAYLVLFVIASFLLINLIKLNKPICDFTFCLSEQLKLFCVVIFDLTMAFSLCVIFAPTAFIHLIEQSLFAVKVNAGWSLPLINPLTLLGLPTLIPVENVMAPSFLVFYVTFIFGLLLIFHHKRNFMSVLSITTFILFYLFYGIWHTWMGVNNNYQVWKFASFVILPLGFICLAQSIEAVKVNKLLILASVAASVISFFVTQSLYFSSKEKNFQNIYQVFKDVEEKTPRSSLVLLDLKEGVDTFIGLNLFTDNFKVKTLGGWYGGSSKRGEVDHYDVLVTKDCNSKGTQQYIAVYKKESSSNFYNFGDGGCGVISDFITLENFYDSELSGRWSRGSHAALYFKFPYDHPLKQSKKIILEVDPFIFNGIVNQEVFVTINNNKKLHYFLSESSKLEINSKEPIYELTFQFFNSVAPRAVGYNGDDREVALFFKKITLLE